MALAGCPDRAHRSVGPEGFDARPLSPCRRGRVEPLARPTGIVSFGSGRCGHANGAHAQARCPRHRGYIHRTRGPPRAKIGSAGANGKATITAYTAGTGTIALKLAKLKASTLTPVVIHKGTCGSVGAILLTLPSIRTTTSGAASRTSGLTAAQVTKIAQATAAGTIAIRVGTGTARKCGLFAQIAVTPVVTAKITVGKSPSGVAIAPNGIWVTNWFDNTLTRIDAATNQVLQTVPVTLPGSAGPEAIAFGEASLWVTSSGFDESGSPLPGTLLRIDPASGQPQATIPIGRGAYDIEVSRGAAWVALYDDNAVVRVDTTTNQVATSIAVTGNPIGLAFGAGSLWIGCGNGIVARVDPATNGVVATTQAQDTGGFVAFGANAVWMSNAGHEGMSDGKVSRIDPATNTVVASVTIGSVGPYADPIAFAGGSVWVGLTGTPEVVRLSATTNAILNRLTVAHKPYALAASNHAAWVVLNLPTEAGASSPPNGILSRISY